VREGGLDAHGGFVGDIHRIVLERTLTMERLFTFAHPVERAALDELALDETVGPASEPWPLVARLIRRGSFDVLQMIRGDIIDPDRLMAEAGLEHATRRGPTGRADRGSPDAH
jgi:hypothetical protein